MALTTHFILQLQQELTLHEAQPVTITEAKPVSGGSINRVYCLVTGSRNYLLKLNSKTSYPFMFACEKAGLEALAAARAIAIPQVFALGDFESESYLILEWIETGTGMPASSALLGQQLAQLHHCTAAKFGFESDNYMGSLTQSNRRHSRWEDFFIRERLQPMVRIARNKDLLQAADLNAFEQLYRKIAGLFPAEQPALLHGDLWSGNYMIDQQGKPYLIDPAVSYGHREFDIAMTALFGGFDRAFYNAYHEAFPLQPGWQQRVSLWNLYPLLLHLNLFGTGYLSRVKAALHQYV